MSKYIQSFLIFLLFAPNVALAASPVLTYIFQQINQLNDRVTANADDIDTNATNISINTSNIDTSTTNLQQQIDQLQVENNAQQLQIDAIPKSAKFVDANGVVIGDAQINNSTSGAYVLFQAGENIYQAFIVTSDGEVDFDGYLYYDGPDCTGNVYAWPFGTQPSPGIDVLNQLGKDGIFYTADINMPAYLTGPIYYWSHGECKIDTGNANTYHAVPVLDVSSYTKPFSLKLFPTQ